MEHVVAHDRPPRLTDDHDDRDDADNKCNTSNDDKHDNDDPHLVASQSSEESSVGVSRKRRV